MTTVVIPQIRTGTGDVVEALVHVRLVVGGGLAAIGFSGTDLATEYLGVVIPSDEPLELELAPQSAIAMPGGEPTYYEIAVRARHRSEQYLVQVPDSVTPIHLRSLVAATAVDPADILAGRLLPDPAEVADGQVLSVDAGLPVWGDPADTGLADAPLIGGPYGRFEGTWVEAVGPAGPAGAAGPAGPAGADSTVPGPPGPAGPAGVPDARRHDWAAPYDYCGLAPAGSLDSAEVWDVTRIELSAVGAVVATLTATGIAWDNHLTATYI